MICRLGQASGFHSNLFEYRPSRASAHPKSLPRVWVVRSAALALGPAGWHLTVGRSLVLSLSWVATTPWSFRRAAAERPDTAELAATGGGGHEDVASFLGSWLGAEAERWVQSKERASALRFGWAPPHSWGQWKIGTTQKAKRGETSRRVVHRASRLQTNLGLFCS